MKALYYSFVCPIVENSSIIWGTLSFSHKTMIEKIQRKLFRLAFLLYISNVLLMTTLPSNINFLSKASPIAENWQTFLSYEIFYLNVLNYHLYYLSFPLKYQLHLPVLHPFLYLFFLVKLPIQLSNNTSLMKTANKSHSFYY